MTNSSKLKEFADDNFGFDENGGKFYKRVENAEGKGKIACYEQFLLFPQWFQKTVLQTRKNQGLFRKRLREEFFLLILMLNEFINLSVYSSLRSNPMC